MQMRKGARLPQRSVLFFLLILTCFPVCRTDPRCDFLPLQTTEALSPRAFFSRRLDRFGRWPHLQWPVRLWVPRLAEGLGTGVGPALEWRGWFASTAEAALSSGFENKTIVELVQAILDLAARQMRWLTHRGLSPATGRHEEWDLVNEQNRLQQELSRRLAVKPSQTVDILRAFHEGLLELSDGAIDAFFELNPKEGIGLLDGQRTGQAMLNVSTPYSVLRRVFSVVPVQADDVIYDLGCGWGRPSLYAGATTPSRKVVGIEIDGERIKEAAASVRKRGLDQVRYISQNVVESDYGDGTIFFMYNPFSEDVLEHELKKLELVAARRAREGRTIRIISIGGLSTLRLQAQPWLLAQLPVQEGPVSIFIFESKLPGVASRETPSGAVLRQSA